MPDTDEKSGSIDLARPEEEALRLKNLAGEKYDSGDFNSAVTYANRARDLCSSVSGLPEMLTAFEVLGAAAVAVLDSTAENEKPTPDYYRILQVQRFSHINSIKKQYKKLALTLHPDKNPFKASEEAFKLVGEAARVLSDKIRRKEYDMRLRVAMQSEAAQAAELGEDGGEEAFQTACSACQLLLKFERKYMGHNLMCPNCKKTFKAMEVKEGGSYEGNGEDVEKNEGVRGGQTRVSARIKEKVAKGGYVGIVEKSGLGMKRRYSSMEEDSEKSGERGAKLKKVEISEKSGKGDDIDNCSLRKMKNLINKDRVGEVERADAGEDESMTLSQIQAMVKKKKKLVNGEITRNAKEVDAKKLQANEKEEEIEKVKERKHEKENVVEEESVEEIEDVREDDIMEEMENVREEEGKEEAEKEKEANSREKSNKRRVTKARNSETVEATSNDHHHSDKEKEKEMGVTREKRERRRVSKYGNLDMLNMREQEREEEAEKERETDLSAKSNQKRVPKVRDSEKRERRRVSKYGDSDISNDSNNHMGSDTKLLAARKKGGAEIMPVEDSDFHDFDKDRRERSFKKGQVWAAYDDADGMPRHYALINEISLNPFEVTLSWLQLRSNGDEEVIKWLKKGFHVSCGTFLVTRKVTVKFLNLFSHPVDCERAAKELYRIYPNKGSVWAAYSNNSNQGIEGERCYDVVVCLSSYSDIHGVSIAYLEKVPRFKTIFRRREIGVNAVVCLEAKDIKTFSHQIPAKKLSGKESADLPKDCWELDPASLTPQLLIVS